MAGGGLQPGLQQFSGGAAGKLEALHTTLGAALEVLDSIQDREPWVLEDHHA